ncbi:low temperature requirement protein A [Pengzhenrongella sicca]|uniref:Low temperature requirement protein A n=2 Tax=Pengzhenrongella sicca TaxID=2819238 RepID=A0A8A4ZHZ2_9MICO|nr:low temperature requirement protein A [Pengzhenrongella sicca]
MAGRDPGEGHRPASPLELLFDLTFVVAFGQAADQLAHLVAAGHPAPGVIGFVVAIASTCWAWINFSWFASAYDTDDWSYRLTTMVQMIGVVVFALGLPDLFASLEEGHGVDNAVMVAGYVIMRIAMIGQWLRVARQDPERRRTAVTYVSFVGVAQLGWIVLALADQSTAAFLCGAALLFVLECTGPVVAERRFPSTPWNPQHIAERHGLLAIIALGEVIFGTVAAVSGLVQEQGWSAEAVLVVVAGVGIAFGLWWSYFIIPSAEILARHRRRAFVWAYGHVAVYGSIAATGAGLHVAAYVIEGSAVVGVLGAIVAISVPLLASSVALFGLYAYLLHDFDPLHVALFVGSVVLLLIAVVLAGVGVAIGVCLLIVTLAPAVVVVGYEAVGHRRQAAALARALR